MVTLNKNGTDYCVVLHQIIQRISETTINTLSLFIFVQIQAEVKIGNVQSYLSVK